MDADERHPVVNAIVDKIKSEGIFDALRKDCLADVDSKSAYQNLKQKVENACCKFLSNVVWTSSLNKVQLREQMRRNLEETGVLSSGVRRLVRQVVTPKIDQEVKPKVAQVVCEYLGINPDDLLQEENAADAGVGDIDFSQPPPPVSLFPFNPYEPPPPIAGPPPLPGFGDNVPPPLPTSIASAPSADQPPADTELQVDEGDTNTNTQNASEELKDSDVTAPEEGEKKPEMDMDCTVTSDEDETDAAEVDGSDLTKGLAAYFADDAASSHQEEADVDDDDAMSISASDRSQSITPVSGDGNSQQAPAMERENAGLPIGADNTKQEAELKSIGSASSTSTTRLPAATERREMRRQRTRNRKYLSDDFTSIFTERRDLLSEAYTSHNDDTSGQQLVLEEEIITTEITNSVTDAGRTTPTIKDVAEAKELENKPQQQEEAAAIAGDHIETGEEPCVSTERCDSRASSSASSQSGGGGTDKLSKQRYDSSDLYKPRPSTRRRSVREAPPTQLTVSTRVLRSGRTVRTPSADTQTNSDGTVTFIGPAKGKEEQHDVADKCDIVSDTAVVDKRNDSERSDNLERTTPVTELLACSQEDSNNITGEESSHVNDTDPVPPPSTQCLTTGDPEPPPLPPTTADGSLLTTDDQPPAPPPADIETSCLPPQPDEAAEPPIQITSAGTVDRLAGDAGVAADMDISTPPQYGEELEELNPGGSEQSQRAQPAGIEEQRSDVVVESEMAVPEDMVQSEMPIVTRDPEESGVVQVDEESASVQMTSEAPPVEEGEEEEDDTEELERLAQRKLEILKAIELPDSILYDRRGGGGSGVKESSSEEEGEITDSSSEDERRKRKKKKSKKSKKKKSKKDHKRRRHGTVSGDSDDNATQSSFKRGRYY